MKLKKLMLPMMAMIFAIGMAFASVDLKPESPLQAQDYVLIDGVWEAIPEQDCGEGEQNCRAQLTQGGEVFNVYDEMSTSTLKEGDGAIRRLYE